MSAGGKFRFVPITGHHYEGVPDFWEIRQSGNPVTTAWFFNEDRARGYCDVMNPRPADTAIDHRRLFLNMVRSLYNIDLSAIRRRLPQFTMDQWETFMVNPPRFLIACDDPTADAIWACVVERQRPEIRAVLEAAP